MEKVKIPVTKPKEAQMADARLAAYKLLSAASHTLYLTYPLVDITQQKCYPASVLLQIQRMFPRAEALKQQCIAFCDNIACRLLSLCTGLFWIWLRYCQHWSSFDAGSILSKAPAPFGKSCAKRAGKSRGSAVSSEESGFDAAIFGK